MIEVLPAEILAHIFEAYLAIPRPAELDNLSEHSRNAYVDSSPFVLMQVCKDWYKTATETPTLWSKLAIFERPDCDWHDMIVEVSRPHAEVVLKSITRAGALLKSLEIYCSPCHLQDFSRGNTKPPADATPLTSILTPSSLRNVRTLSLSKVRPVEGMEDWLFPEVWSLVFTTNEMGTTTAFPRLPKLEKLVMSYYFHGDPSEFLPWGQLTHLYIENNQPLFSVVRPILLHTLKLQEGLFHIDDFELGTDASDMGKLATQPVVHSHLTKLTFLSKAPFRAMSAFTNLSWPNLKFLGILHDASEYLLHQTDMSIFASITSLRLDGLQAKDIPSFQDLFVALPAITHLRLAFVAPYLGAHTETLNWLTFTPDQPLLPRLEQLQLQFSVERYLPHIETRMKNSLFKTLTTMVRSRTFEGEGPDHRAKLRRLHIFLAMGSRGSSAGKPWMQEAFESYTGNIEYSVQLVDIPRCFNPLLLAGEFIHWDDGFPDIVENLFY